MVHRRFKRVRVVSEVEAEQTKSGEKRGTGRGGEGWEGWLAVTTPTGRVHFPRWQGCRLVAFTGLGPPKSTNSRKGRFIFLKRTPNGVPKNGETVKWLSYDLVTEASITSASIHSSLSLFLALRPPLFRLSFTVFPQKKKKKKKQSAQKGASCEKKRDRWSSHSAGASRTTWRRRTVICLTVNALRLLNEFTRFLVF